MRMKRTRRSTILGANRRLAKLQELHAPGNNPDAACIYDMHRKDGEKEQCCILSRLEPKQVLRASHQLYLLHGWSSMFAGKISISWFVLRTHRVAWIIDMKMLDDMRALANSVYLLGLSCYGRHVLALLLCVVRIAPCCAECAVAARRPYARTYDF